MSSKKQLTDYQKTFIKNNYLSMTNHDIASTLQLTVGQVRHYANNKLGLKKISNPYNLFSEEEKQYIFDNYNIIPTGEIAKKVNSTTKKVNDFAYRNGFKRDIVNYSLNEDYFKVIDTEEKAYWLGFLYADGCILEHKTKPTLILELSLAKTDEQHIFSFREAIGSNAPIRDRVIKKKYYASRITICNTNFCRSLIKLKCMPRKSLTLTFPTTDIVPKRLQRHFIRGYFDGDGCVHYNIESKQKSYSVSFVGTKEFLCELQNILYEDVGLTKTVIKSKCGGKAYQCIWGGKGNLKKFYDYLYAESEVSLDRKKEKFINVLLPDYK